MPDFPPIDRASYDKIIIDRGYVSVGRKIAEGMQLVLQNHNYSYGNYLQKLSEDDDYRPVFALLGYAASASNVEFTPSGRERAQEDMVSEKLMPFVSSCEILTSLNAEGYARRIVDTLIGAIGRMDQPKE